MSKGTMIPSFSEAFARALGEEREGKELLGITGGIPVSLAALGSIAHNAPNIAIDLAQDIGTGFSMSR